MILKKKKTQLQFVDSSRQVSATLLNISWIAVELPANDTAIFNPLGGMSHTEALMLLGIHSTK